MELNKLYEGDCLEIMPILPDKSIDMILCDLPYGTTACKWDIIIPFEPLWKQYKRLIKDNGAIVLFGSEPFSSFLRTSNIGWFRYDWIWDKVRPSGFQIAKFVPMKRHEVVSVFSNGTARWFPIKEQRERPVKGRVCKQSDSSPLKYSDGVTRIYADKNPQSILKYYKGSDGAYLHPTQKPVALFKYLIRTYTNEGDTVMDNCAGSGTTGIACLNTNRKYILIEKNNEYCKIIRNRIENYNNLNQNTIIKNKQILPFFRLMR